MIDDLRIFDFKFLISSILIDLKSEPCKYIIFGKMLSFICLYNNEESNNLNSFWLYFTLSNIEKRK